MAWEKVCSMIFLDERLPCGTFMTVGAEALPVDLGSMAGFSAASAEQFAIRHDRSVAIDHCR